MRKLSRLEVFEAITDYPPISEAKNFYQSSYQSLIASMGVAAAEDLYQSEESLRWYKALDRYGEILLLRNPHLSTSKKTKSGFYRTYHRRRYLTEAEAYERATSTGNSQKGGNGFFCKDL